MSSTMVGLRCLRCDAPAELPGHGGCTICQARGLPTALTTVYDMAAAAHVFDDRVLRNRATGPARFAELLPPGVEHARLAGGSTPLIRLERLQAELGLRALWLKDESRNATWSFKDRPAAVAAGCAVHDGAPGLVVSSTGNAAASTAAFAASSGLPAVVLVAQGVDPVMAAFLAGFDAHVFAAATKADRWQLMRYCVEEFGLYPNSNYMDPPIGNDPRATDGYKVIAYEVWEQLGRRTPTIMATPVGYGDAIHAFRSAFAELSTLTGTAMPRFVCGEIYGSLTGALARGDEQVSTVPIDRPTVASSIGTAQSTYQAMHAIRSSDGHVSTVAETDILEAQRLLVHAEGVLAEAASAAGLAGLRAALASGTVSPDDEVVLLNTSAGIKSISSLGYLGAEEPDVVELVALEQRLAQILPGRAMT